MNAFALLTPSHVEELSNVLSIWAIITKILSHDLKNVSNAILDVLTTRYLLRSLNPKDKLKIPVRVH